MAATVTLQVEPLTAGAFAAFGQVIEIRAGATPPHQRGHRGRQGVNYLPGTWHHPLLALDTVSEFLVADQSGAAGAADCEAFALDGVRLVIPSAAGH